MTDICNRFKKIREDRKMSITAVAAEIGEKRQRLQDIEAGKQKIPEDIIVKYIDYFLIDANWLLTGKGEMRPASIQTAKEHYREAVGADFSRLEPTGATLKTGLEDVMAWEDFDLVPFYDVEASAGAGAFVDQEFKISEMAFRKDWLRLRGLKATQCTLIKARGDSMEPTIHDGDLLLVDRSIETIKDDAIYIIQADHHLTVKRVQQTLDGSLIVISDNDKYVNQTIDATKAEKIKVAGRVRWYGHEI